MKRSERNSKDKKTPQDAVTNAHREADKDMARDPDNIHSPNDDLDEGALARLGENPQGI